MQTTKEHWEKVFATKAENWIGLKPAHFISKFFELFNLPLDANIDSDITDFKPSVKFDFWHDRAAFHFLTSEEQINMLLLPSRQ